MCINIQIFQKLENPFTSIILAILLLSGCKESRRQLVENAPLISLVVVDTHGDTLHFPEAPKRIISLVPSATETVCALGSGDRLVGVSETSRRVCTANASILQTYPTLDTLALLHLKPDCVLISDGVFEPESFRAWMSKYKIPVYCMGSTNLETMFQSLRQVGQLVEQPQQANHLADSMKRIFTAIQKQTREQIQYPTLVLLDLDLLTVVGGEGYWNELIETAGGKNIFQNLSGQYPVVKLDAILKAQPEFIFLLTQDEQILQKWVSQTPEIADLPAVVNKQVFILDPDVYFTTGPSIVRSILELTRSIHPKVDTDAILRRK